MNKLFFVLTFLASFSFAYKGTGELQKIVEDAAKANSSVVRLSVHGYGHKGKQLTYLASTAKERVGTKSDAEDFDAIKQGKMIILNADGGAQDFTIPVAKKKGKYTAAVGVTIMPEKDADAAKAAQDAKAIAETIEKSL